MAERRDEDMITTPGPTPGATPSPTPGPLPGDVRQEFERRTTDETRDAGSPPVGEPIAPKRWTIPTAGVVTLIIAVLFVLGYLAFF